MNEKPVKLDKSFGEALVRLAKTPKEAIGSAKEKTLGKLTPVQTMNNE